jgi:hypothetical protein
MLPQTPAGPLLVSRLTGKVRSSIDFSGYAVNQDLPGKILSKLGVMSYTFKNTTRKQRFLELVRRDDGTCDLFLDDPPDRSSIPTKWLQEELCARFGFCGEECESILREVNLAGRARLTLFS